MINLYSFIYNFNTGKMITSMGDSILPKIIKTSSKKILIHQLQLLNVFRNMYNQYKGGLVKIYGEHVVNIAEQADKTKDNKTLSHKLYTNMYDEINTIVNKNANDECDKIMEEINTIEMEINNKK